MYVCTYVYVSIVVVVVAVAVDVKMLNYIQVIVPYRLTFKGTKSACTTFQDCFVVVCRPRFEPATLCRQSDALRRTHCPIMSLITVIITRKCGKC